MTQSLKEHLKRKGFDLSKKSEKEIIGIIHNEYHLSLSKEDIIKNSDTKIPIINEGVYCLYVLIKNFEIVYVGITKKLLYRIGEHQKNKSFDSVFVILVNENQMINEEFKFICKFKPKYNGEIISNNRIVNYINENLYNFNLCRNNN